MIYTAAVKYQIGAFLESLLGSEVFWFYKRHFNSTTAYYAFKLKKKKSLNSNKCDELIKTLESSTPCVLIPPSPFTFVENFQCFELVLEQKWKQGLLCFFSSIILWFSGMIILPSPSETLLSETWQFLTLSSYRLSLPERAQRRILPCCKNGEINHNVCCTPAQGRACKPRCLPLVLVTRDLRVLIKPIFQLFTYILPL